MRNLLNGIRNAWRFMFHPVKMTNHFFKETGWFAQGVIFLTLSAGLWALQNAYVQFVLKETPRGREKIIGIPIDIEYIIIPLLIPIAFLIVGIAAFVTSKVAERMGATANVKESFALMALTLNGASIFIDYPHELGWALTGAPWKLHECVPNFLYWSIFVMFMPIIWGLIVTFIALKTRYQLSYPKTILAFFIGVLPIFLVLLFIVA